MNHVPALLVAFACWMLATATVTADWPHFRGPDATGFAAAGAIPANIGDKETLAWSVDLPGRGPSGPIAVGDSVVVTASSGGRQEKLHILCFDAETGEQRWHRQFWATGRTFCHPSSANAAPTPASDGKQVFAFYSSNDLVCVDLDGRFQWFRGLAYDHPKAGNDVGMASSPLVIGDTVIVQVENQADSFATGINTATGETRWQKERPAASNWTSPVAIDTSGGKLAALQSGEGVSAVDPATGSEVWSLNIGCSTIPSSLVTDGLLVTPANGLTAYKLGGDKPEFAWQSIRLSPSTNSPVCAADKVFAVNGGGILTCATVADGEDVWRLRLQGPVWASPVVAGNRMLVVSGKGRLQVVEFDNNKGELVHTHDLDATIQATPAVTERGVFVRSDSKLWRFVGE
jgi:outer membrane protein assembly factor BamB